MNFLRTIDKPRLRIETWFRLFSRGTRSRDRWRTVVFIHIPKTAGTSVHKYLKDCLGPGASGNTVRINLREDIDQQIRQTNWNKVRYVSGHFGWEFVERLPVIDPFIFTFLRDPKERLRSWCRFHEILYFRENHESELRFDINIRLGRVIKWLRNRPYWTDNLMVRQLSCHANVIPSDPSEWEVLLDLAKNNINQIEYVGFQDSFAHDFSFMMHILGLPRFLHSPHHNLTQTKYDQENIPDLKIEEYSDFQETVNKLSHWDNKLYRYALSHRHI